MGMREHDEHLKVTSFIHSTDEQLKYIDFIEWNTKTHSGESSESSI